MNRAGWLGLANGTTEQGKRQTATLPLPPALLTPYKWERLLIGPSRQAGAFDEKSADIPFVFRHGPRFYMTYVGFDGIGYQTGLASSVNLTHWRREGLILPRDPRSPVLRYNAALTWILRENSVFGLGRLKKVHGCYLGAYHAYPERGLEAGPAVIGLCRSPDLRHWQVEPPCLRPQDGADWERSGLYKACLLEYAGQFHIFYNAKNRPTHWREQIGMASSRDLKTWTRNPANPILRNGPPGSLDERFASDPCVLRFQRQWAIFYYGLDREGVARDLLALSPDMTHTRKCRGALVAPGPQGTVDSVYSHKPSILAHRQVLYHFYCAVSPHDGRGISVAASRPWTKTPELYHPFHP